MSSNANAINMGMNPAGSFAQYIDQGSWTPTITGTTAAGVGTYTLQAGTYTRIGNVVFLGGTVVWTAHTGTGSMLLTGLPFTSRNVPNYRYILNVNLIQVTLPAGVVQIMGELNGNTTQLILKVMRNNNTNLFVGMDAAGQLDVSGFYLI